ncbi:MAG TPA: hypothetical protein DIT13_15250 [Verrucomicrobiales bacterium]|nr:hypothetical protein [Verrucomicrobiales bacterium]
MDSTVNFDGAFILTPNTFVFRKAFTDPVSVVLLDRSDEVGIFHGVREENGINSWCRVTFQFSLQPVVGIPADEEASNFSKR